MCIRDRARQVVEKSKILTVKNGREIWVPENIGYTVAGAMGPQFIPALLTSMAGAAVLGIVIEKLAYRPLRYAPRIASLTTAIGVSLFLQNWVRKFISPNFLAFPDLINRITWEIGGLTLSNVQVIVPIVAILLVVVLQWVVLKTKPGKALRAVSLDTDCAQLMGVDVDRVISLTFALGSALAAAGIDAASRPLYLQALTALADSGMIIPREEGQQ